MEARKTMLPPVFWAIICLSRKVIMSPVALGGIERSVGGTYRAAACAERKEPVVLISSLLFHSEDDISMACVHPTTPAKQHNMSTLPSSEAASVTADRSCSASVTSTLTGSTVAPGNSALSASISGIDFAWSRSKRARPERPCSSKARALTRARVPAPPVTVRRPVSAGWGRAGGGGSRWGGTLETMCRRTDGVAFDGETFDCSAFGGEVVGHWGGRAGHGGGVARGEGHVGDGASAEVILGGVWWGGHCGGRVDGERGSCLVT